jgi:serine/threonine-protein kinase
MGTEREISIAHARPQTRSAVGQVGMAAATEFVMPFANGELIAGKYKVIDLIGTGGVGFVVSARHVRLDELVAIKFLRPEFVRNVDAVKRFTAEARANFKIKNDHVVRVLDVDALEDGAPFIVMELLEGVDLGRIVSTRGPLPAAQAVEYVLQACEAIAAAHACYVVHRDIKPENLFITRDGPEAENVKVLDFGISKLALGSALTQRATQANTVLGSPPYMSPEQLRAAEEVDSRTDIWSLGCVLYELLTGVAPFERSSVPEICAAVLDDEPPPLRLMQPSIAPELDAIVLRCLQKQPELRYQDVAALAAALLPFAPAEATKYAERCRKLLDVPEAIASSTTLPEPTPEPEAGRPHMSEAHEDGMPELAQFKRAERRSLARFALYACGMIAVTYAIVQGLALSASHAAHTRVAAASVAVQSAMPSAAARANAIDLPPAPAAELVAPAPVAPAPPVAETPVVRKKPFKSRALPRVARRTGDEPDVGF